LKEVSSIHLEIPVKDKSRTKYYKIKNHLQSTFVIKKCCLQSQKNTNDIFFQYNMCKFLCKKIII